MIALHSQVSVTPSNTTASSPPLWQPSKEEERQLTIMAQFQKIRTFAFNSLMASSEVDQKFLGRFAKETHVNNPFLSAMLYKVLGLSVLLHKKLIRARRLRRLDTTRDTKSLQLYHHIIWLSREGLTILEEYVLPMVDNYAFELQVLAHKLRASFYHIFVLFHNQPSIHATSIPASTSGAVQTSGSMRRSPPPLPTNLPPGLAPVSIPKPSATFLLPARNYIPSASTYFSYASELADEHLFGSHPVRLSVKTEYAAYLYDCLHDGPASRKLAAAAIRDVYNAEEGMDDDMFEDSAEMVGILGRMMRRGLRSENNSGSDRGNRNSSSTPASEGGLGGSPSVGGRRSGGSGSATTPGSTPRPVPVKPQPQEEAMPAKEQSPVRKKSGNGNGNGTGDAKKEERKREKNILQREVPIVPSRRSGTSSR